MRKVECWTKSFPHQSPTPSLKRLVLSCVQQFLLQKFGHVRCMHRPKPYSVCCYPLDSSQMQWVDVIKVLTVILSANWENILRAT